MSESRTPIFQEQEPVRRAVRERGTTHFADPYCPLCAGYGVLVVSVYVGSSGGSVDYLCDCAAPKARALALGDQDALE